MTLVATLCRRQAQSLLPVCSEGRWSKARAPRGVRGWAAVALGGPREPPPPSRSPRRVGSRGGSRAAPASLAAQHFWSLRCRGKSERLLTLPSPRPGGGRPLVQTSASIPGDKSPRCSRVERSVSTLGSNVLSRNTFMSHVCIVDEISGQESQETTPPLLPSATPARSAPFRIIPRKRPKQTIRLKNGQRT